MKLKELEGKNQNGRVPGSGQRSGSAPWRERDRERERERERSKWFKKKKSNHSQTFQSMEKTPVNVTFYVSFLFVCLDHGYKLLILFLYICLFLLTDLNGCHGNLSQCQTVAVCDGGDNDLLCRCRRGYYFRGRQCHGNGTKYLVSKSVSGRKISHRVSCSCWYECCMVMK